MFQLWLQLHYRTAPRQHRAGSHIWRKPRRSDSSGAAALKMTSCLWCIFNCVRNVTAFYPQVGHVSCLSYSPLCTLFFLVFVRAFFSTACHRWRPSGVFSSACLQRTLSSLLRASLSVLEHILEASGMISAWSGSPFMALCAMKEPSASVGEIIIRHGLNRGGWQELEARGTT